MDVAVTESSLLSLPDEILSMIMAFTMASEEPVKLRLFLDLNRDFNDQQDCHRRFPPGFRFSSPSRLDLLPLDQKAHYLDWLVVNGTCNRIRRVGKSAFFREKSFMIHESLFHALRANKVTNMTASDLALAKTAYATWSVKSHGESLQNLPFSTTSKALASTNLDTVMARTGNLPMNEIWCLYGALNDPRLRWSDVRFPSKTVAAGSAVSSQRVTRPTDSQTFEKHESLKLLNHQSSNQLAKLYLDQCKGNGEVRVPSSIRSSI